MSLAGNLQDRVDLILPVARGRADMLSIHTATLALIEALLVGIAARKPKDTIESLQALNLLREQLVGQPMDIGTKSVERRDGFKRQQRRNQGRRKRSRN